MACDVPCFQLTFIGDRHVGKTSLIRSYLTGRFKSANTNAIYEAYRGATIDEDYTSVSIPFDGVSYQFTIRDTLYRNDGYERLFPLQCIGTSVLICCYSVDDRTSFANLQRNIIPHVTYNFVTPLIIVATKIDRRDAAETKDLDFVTTTEGRAMSRIVKANAFLECSAISGENLQQIFSLAAEEAVNDYKSKEIRQNCTIM